MINKKILITGSTGFIGRNLVKFFLKKKLNLIYEFHIIVRNEEDKSHNYFKGDNIFLYAMDIYSKKLNFNFFNKLKKIDFLIHLAWGGLPNYNSNIHELEFHNQRNFFKKILKHNIRNIIVAGTCFEYGKINGKLKENTIPKESTKYGRAKYKLFKFLKEKTKNTKIKLNWLRIFYIYGEDQNPNSLYPQLLKSIKIKKKIFNLSPGNQIRDFIHINFFLNIIHKIILKNRSFNVINICSGNPISVKNFALKIIKKYKSKIKLNTGYYDYPSYEPMNFWGCPKKLNKFKNEQ